MDVYSGKKEIEKPKTPAQQRAKMELELHAAIVLFGGRRDAAALMFGENSPIAGWMKEAASICGRALFELTRGRR